MAAHYGCLDCRRFRGHGQERVGHFSHSWCVPRWHHEETSGWQGHCGSHFRGQHLDIFILLLLLRLRFPSTQLKFLSIHLLNSFFRMVTTPTIVFLYKSFSYSRPRTRRRSIPTDGYSTPSASSSRYAQVYFIYASDKHNVRLLA